MTAKKPFGILFNEDFMHFIESRHRLGISPDREEIQKFLLQYKGSQVTDFIFNLNASLSYTPSKILQTCFDKYLQKEENGVPVDYTDSYLETAYRIQIVQGIDLYGEWIRLCREIGIRPWLSFRLNDCHDNLQPAGLRSSDYFHEAQRKGLARVRHRPPEDYYDRCLDFKKGEVQERLLAYIEEQVNRYDADGVELDWMREMFCFVPGEEEQGREILNEFTRQVRRILDAAEKKWGHEMKIMARLPRDPVQAYQDGFDYYTWVREHLVDVLVVTPRWASCDNQMPLEVWRKILDNLNAAAGNSPETEVRLAGGMEILSCGSGEGAALCTHLEGARANAAQFWGLGADHVYLFNYADLPGGFREEDYTGGRPSCAGGNYRELLSSIGSPETCLGVRRDHMLTYQDVGLPWQTLDRPLPSELELEARPGEYSRRKFFRLPTGKIPEGSRVTLLLGISGGTEDNLEAYVNSCPCGYEGRGQIAQPYTSSPVYAFSVSRPEGGYPLAQIIELGAKGCSVTVDYLEIRVEPEE